MLKGITLATQKGGAGKSTLAASLAVAAAQDGHGVVFVDLDPQKSLMLWSRRRDTGEHEARVHYRAIEDRADPKRRLDIAETRKRFTALMSAAGAHESTTVAII